ncbi:hypothetical protein JCM10207_008249 [Rhodosporidiobolus poonsookiae]
MLGRSAATARAAFRAATHVPTPARVPPSLRPLSSFPSSRQEQRQQPAPKLPDQPAVQDPFVPATAAEAEAAHPLSSPSSSSPAAATPPPPSPSQTPPPPSPAPPVLEPEPLPEPAAPVSRVRRPVGAFRGGLIGFLLGISLTGGYGYFQLLDDYSKASSELLSSVEELRGSTEQMATLIPRISALEQSSAALAESAATKADLDSLRAEYRKLLDAEHLDVLEMKAHIWALEQDLHKLSKRQTSVRI